MKRVALAILFALSSVSPSAVKAEASPPTVTRNLQAFVESEGMTLIWRAPLSNGGSVITGYHIKYSRDDGITWVDAAANTNSTRTRHRITGLITGDEYLFSVAALSAVGEGAAATVLATIPAPPLRVVSVEHESIGLDVVAAIDDDEVIVAGNQYIQRRTLT
ncbi:MAG: fibronectin type III domain-containing protein, partial [Candidatus Limnocylindrus sp.]